jgi:hypothetical protein
MTAATALLAMPQKIDRHVEYRVRDYVVQW